MHHTRLGQLAIRLNPGSSSGSWGLAFVGFPCCKSASAQHELCEVALICSIKPSLHCIFLQRDRKDADTAMAALLAEEEAVQRKQAAKKQKKQARKARQAVLPAA